ncbi:hypothetical protein HOK51_09065 [Candidatus Woesearchaeota archaeon]|jgi:hypothetical protein|nr:hypothetical protein [Candidatus Woesearchaeota archaeon]MBT6519979.1 hypothetical protein [Candidatus Woesearchaeota archaeon]MBT7367820.1 hypothetical protein [Candidatus Woesearchaeota archaeon]
MVIGPQALAQKVADNNKDSLQQLEAKIDQALERSFDGKRVTLDHRKFFSEIPHYLREEFFNKYRAQGWNVKVVYDQRDGDFVDFTYSGHDLSGGYFPR